MHAMSCHQKERSGCLVCRPFNLQLIVFTITMAIFNAVEEFLVCLYIMNVQSVLEVSVSRKMGVRKMCLVC